MSIAELETPDARAKREEVQASLGRVQQCQSWSNPARGAVRVIEYLLGQ